MENNNKFINFLDDLFSFYESIKHIISIATPEVLLQDYLVNLTKDNLVQDTIIIMKKYNYNFLNLLNIEFNDDSTSNLFTKLNNSFKLLMNSELIENFNSKNSKTIPKSNIKLKKSYEIDILSNFLINDIENNDINNIIEMGCGKSYLTDQILINNKIVYIGVDKKDDLVNKINLKNFKENVYIINSYVTPESFNDMYEKENIADKLNSSNKILLLGLHTCGNLTSDTIKIFLNNKFSHLAIIGCCLHSLKEYVNPKVRISKTFKEYMTRMGYDNKGNFLEQTLIYDYEFDKIGYPLSKYIIIKYENIFLGRTVRNSSMTTYPKHNSEKINIDYDINHRKFLYRPILQAFFEKYFPLLTNFYGFGDIKINTNDNFLKYLNIVLSNLEKILKDRQNLLSSLDNFKKSLEPDIVMKFYQDYLKYDDIVWAIYLIRLKFSKIVEYIIALDRIIYLQENGVENIKLVRIFDFKESARNLMIYASR